jgi:carboxyl-terminal processing protease
LVSVYINSITARFDPHTNFVQKKKDRFDVSISGRKVGAGLQKKK